MINVHYSNDLHMITACHNELNKLTSAKPLLIGITMLTSMEQQDLTNINLDIPPQEQVLHLTGLTAKTGLDGLICSAQEAQALKVAQPRLQLMTPNIRPAGSNADDQKRILTPHQTPYRDWETDRKSTRLNSSHEIPSRMPSSA